eukprot:4294005-Prymnesium_polylepis.1
MPSCIDDDNTPVIATAAATDQHTYAVTIAAARAMPTGAALYAFFHRWSNEQQPLPVLAMQTSYAH